MPNILSTTMTSTRRGDKLAVNISYETKFTDSALQNNIGFIPLVEVSFNPDFIVAVNKSDDQIRRNMYGGGYTDRGSIEMTRLIWTTTQPTFYPGGERQVLTTYELTIPLTDLLGFGVGANNIAEQIDAVFSAHEIKLNMKITLAPEIRATTSEEIFTMSQPGGIARTMTTSLALDGQSDYIEFPTASVPVGEALTLSFWAKGGSQLPSDTCVFSAKSMTSGRALSVHLPWSNSYVYFDCGSNVSETDRIYKAASPADYKDRWTHWAFTKGNSVMKIYMDGKLWYTGTGKHKPINPATSVRLGNNDKDDAHWQGRISEVRIWDHERSAADIEADMGRRLTGAESGLVSYWPLDEGRGSTIIDRSGHGHDGTCKGSPTWVSDVPARAD